MMKSFILLIACWVIISGIQAQTILIEEQFNDSLNIPAGWVSADQDNDGNSWLMNTYQGEVYAVSESWKDNSALTPDNFLISPAISLPSTQESISLRFAIGAASQNYYAEHYTVLLSTTDANPASFTQLLIEETLTAQQGNQWASRSADLSAFAGQTIYLAWRHYDCTDQYKLMLDSIRLITIPVNALFHPLQTEIRLFPNPASEEIYLDHCPEGARIEIWNSEGKKVEEMILERKAYVPIAHLAKGVYYLRILSGSGARGVKFIRQ